MQKLINLYLRITGWGKVVMDLLPLLGGLGSLLSVGGSILLRAANAPTPMDALHALTPTHEESAAALLAFGLLKAHFNHVANARLLDDHAEAINTGGEAAYAPASDREKAALKEKIVSAQPPARQDP